MTDTCKLAFENDLLKIDTRATFQCGNTYLIYCCVLSDSTSFRLIQNIGNLCVRDIDLGKIWILGKPKGSHHHSAQTLLLLPTTIQ